MPNITICLRNFEQDFKTKKPIAMSGVEVSKKTQEEEEDELTRCVVDCVGRQSRVSSNAVVGRKPRWDRPTRSGGSHKGGWGKKVG